MSKYKLPEDAIPERKGTGLLIRKTTEETTEKNEVPPKEEKTTPQKKEKPKKSVKKSQKANDSSSEQPNNSSVLPPKHRPTKRFSFDIYKDQIVKISQLKYLSQLNNGKSLSTSKIIRDALEDYMLKKFNELLKLENKTTEL